MTSQSFLIGLPDVAHLTDADGTVSLAPGVPIVELAGQAAAAALLPPLVGDPDTYYGTSIDIPTTALVPLTHFDDADTFFSASIVEVRTLAPATVVIALDSLFTPAVMRMARPKEQRLRPAHLDDVETFFAFSKATGPVFVHPSLVADADLVMASDVGWHLYGDAPVTDADAFHGVLRIDMVVLPERWADEEHLENYPFRLQQLSGGVPVPQRPHLVGSIRSSVQLRGSIRREVRLKGSMSNMKARRR